MSTTRLMIISLPFYCCLEITFVLLLLNATIVNGGKCFWIDGTEVKNRFTCYDLNSVGASMCCDSAAGSAFVNCIGGISTHASNL